MGVTGKIIRWIWIVLFSSLLVLVLLFFLISKGWLGFMLRLGFGKPSEESGYEVYSEDGRVLCTSMWRTGSLWNMKIFRPIWCMPWLPGRTPFLQPLRY
jgi:hypothetical protein